MWFPLMTADDCAFREPVKPAIKSNFRTRLSKNRTLSMSHTPLEHVQHLVKTCHGLEIALRNEAERYKVSPATTADKVRISRQLAHFQEVIQTVTLQKTLPQFGTYTFQRLFDAVIATLKDLVEFISKSITVPPLIAIGNRQ